jgi:hypothetical protein
MKRQNPALEDAGSAWEFNFDRRFRMGRSEQGEDRAAAFRVRSS